MDKELLLPLVEKIEELITANDKEGLAETLLELHPMDIAEIIEEGNVSQPSVIFEVLLPADGALILNEIHRELVADIIDIINEEKLSEILAVMSGDDTADLIAQLPEEKQQMILNLLEAEDLEDISQLLTYGEETAGGIMTTEFVVVLDTITVDQAIKTIREHASEAETIYYLYVIDITNKLVGVISLRELIVAEGNWKLKDIMITNIVTVNLHTDQEEVANIVAKYDLLAVPVVNEKSELMGIVTVDDVIDVIHEEASEDLFKLSGTVDLEDEEDLQKKVLLSLKARLPWLLITMLGGLLSGQVMKGFGDIIQAVVALTFFIPMLMGMGGNVGTQSSTIVVRGLATGYVDSKKIFSTIIKELFVGLSIGVICGLIVAGIALIWQHKPILGLIVGLAMVCNVATAATIGTVVPLLFKKVGVDPAVASAPFISTTVDVTGLLIYSTLAAMLLNFL